MKKKSRCLEILKDIGLIILGGIIFNVVIALAETLLSSNQVIYDNSNSGAYSDTVQGALDELYARTNDYCPENYECEKKYERLVGDVKYYDTEYIGTHPIYFDPIIGEQCSYYYYNNNEDKLGKTGCMKWYAYSENKDGTVNMILDHNTTAQIQWVTKEDYENESLLNTLGVTYTNYGFNDYGDEGNNSKGPLTALKILKEDTNNWLGVLDRQDSYSVDITSIDSSNAENTKRVTYAIDYTGYKARLITAEEVASITGADKTIESGGLGFNINDAKQAKFYFDGALGEDPLWQTQVANQTSKSQYAWLFDNTTGCISYGCNIEDSTNMGYATSSARVTNLNRRWHVGYDGMMNGTTVISNVRGIRPVITIPKSKLQ